jgi:hypothetical protein
MGFQQRYMIQINYSQITKCLVNKFAVHQKETLTLTQAFIHFHCVSTIFSDHQLNHLQNNHI